MPINFRPIKILRGQGCFACLWLVCTILPLIATTVLASPWDEGWRYRKVITVDHARVDDALVDFPVLISLGVDPDLVVHAGIDGGDLVFTDAVGNRLAHQLEHYDGTTGELAAWVKVANLSADDNTTLFLYYGNPSAPVPGAGTAVWDDHFVMVQHGSTMAGQLPDATANRNDGTPFGGLSQGVPGRIAGADAYDGMDDYVRYDLSAGTTWTYYGGNIMPDGEWASVVIVDGVYHMYYVTGVFPYDISHATSTDGKAWTIDTVNNPVLTPGPPGSWDDYWVYVPQVWKEGPTWHMMYGGTGYSSLEQVGHATSSDGLNWVRDPANPVYAHGAPGEWDDATYELDAGSVIKVGSDYYMWVTSYPSGGSWDYTRKIGLAHSTDLTNWTKIGENPIFSDWRYCPTTFKYDGLYYIVTPHRDGSGVITAELWSCPNPLFLPAERSFIKNVFEGIDVDTPFVLTDDCHHDTFPGDQLWCYYSRTSLGFVGLTIEPDMAAALAPPPIAARSLDITGPELTLETWILKQPGEQAYAALIKEGVAPYGYYLGAGYLGDDRVYFSVKNGEGRYAATQLGLDGGWHHIAGTFNAGAHEIYIDGVTVPFEELIAGEWPATVGSTSYPLLSGSYYASQFYRATLDEVRVSDQARSAAWLHTSFLNQSDPAGFFAIGPEMDSQLVGVPGVNTPSPLVTAVQPNPFNPRTSVSFELPRAEHVQVTIHDLRGVLVKILNDTECEAGRHVVVWDGRDARGRMAAAGTYIVRLTAGSQQDERKLQLVK